VPGCTVWRLGDREGVNDLHRRSIERHAFWRRSPETSAEKGAMG
jgi:hypothetical protein